jgi:hypothetical protein
VIEEEKDYQMKANGFFIATSNDSTNEGQPLPNVPPRRTVQLRRRELGYALEPARRSSTGGRRMGCWSTEA